jgi:hypothetical protein
MRGMDERSELLFSYVDLEGRVPGSHSLRAIRLIVNKGLSVLTARFEALCSPFGHGEKRSNETPASGTNTTNARAREVTVLPIPLGG